jgi:hypothetical protein
VTVEASSEISSSSVSGSVGWLGRSSTESPASELSGGSRVLTSCHEGIMVAFPATGGASTGCDGSWPHEKVSS